MADLFSTDPAIIENDLVTLEDSKNLFLAENIIPIGNEQKLTDPVEKVLDKVSAELTTEDLIEMNSRVAEFEDMGDIAQDWLAEHDLA